MDVLWEVVLSRHFEEYSGGHLKWLFRVVGIVSTLFGKVFVDERGYFRPLRCCTVVIVFLEDKMWMF